MNKETIIGLIIVGVLIIAGFAFFNKGSGSQGDVSNVDIDDDTANIVPAPGSEGVEESIVNNEDNTRTVDIISLGFSPQILEISQGDTVTFVNKDTNIHWPATDVHPSHRVYPGSSIAKCNTAEANRIFDACKGLSRGESFSFTFNEIGNWRYHDHLNPGLKGTIIVR